MSEVRMPLRVRFHECDPQGVVFNAHYLAYFDMASFEFLRELFGAPGALAEFGVDIVVAESNVRYLRSARFDDELIVRTTISQLGTTSMVLDFAIDRGTQIVTTGQNRYVFVDAAAFTKTAIPAKVRERLAAFQEN